MEYPAQRWYLILVSLLILMPGILFTACGGVEREGYGEGYSVPTMESTVGGFSDSPEAANLAAHLAATQAARIESVGNLEGYEVYRVYDQEACTVLYIAFWSNQIKTVTPPILIPCYRIGGP